MNNPFHVDVESMTESQPSGDFSEMIDKLYAHQDYKDHHVAGGVQSFREKIENLLPSMTKLFSASHNSHTCAPSTTVVPAAKKGPSFIDCWTSTATSAGQSSRTRVLNIKRDGTYTFWEELIMEQGVGIESGNGAVCDENKPKRRGSLTGRKCGPPKFRIRKSSGEWTRDGKTMILLKGLGSELSGECGDYEEDISPRGNNSNKWHHIEAIAVEHLTSDWSCVEHDKVNELLC